MEISIVYIPTPDAAVADRLTKLLLDAKLIACANIIESKSMYLWEGVLNQDAEFLMICKTLPMHLVTIQTFVKVHHPYEVPSIVSWSANCNEEYYEWVKSQIIFLV